MQVLVTGGAGYIGSHTCKALRKQGLTPVVLDNLSTGHRSAVRFGPFVEGDISDIETIVATLKAYAIGAVMHFAASAHVGTSCTHPADYYRNNVAGTLHLLEAMGRCGVHKLVFSSTCAIFGPPTTPTLNEAHRQNPISPYGATKAVVERILQDYAQAYGLRSTALRYFNAAGADAEGQLGEQHVPETHLIPLALQAARDGTKLMIFGDDYATPDGTCVRDYVHVDDLAQAHLLALLGLKGLSGKGFKAFNLGLGRGFSVREIIDCVQRVTGKKLHIQIGPRRLGDPPTLVACPDRATRLLNWRPVHTRIDAIVSSAWSWMKIGQPGHLVYPQSSRTYPENVVNAAF